MSISSRDNSLFLKFIETKFSKLKIDIDSIFDEVYHLINQNICSAGIQSPEIVEKQSINESCQIKPIGIQSTQSQNIKQMLYDHNHIQDNHCTIFQEKKLMSDSAYLNLTKKEELDLQNINNIEEDINKNTFKQIKTDTKIKFSLNEDPNTHNKKYRLTEFLDLICNLNLDCEPTKLKYIQKENRKKNCQQFLKKIASKNQSKNFVYIKTNIQTNLFILNEIQPSFLKVLNIDFNDQQKILQEINLRYKLDCHSQNEISNNQN